MMRPILAIVGPTATGKTKLSIALAKKLKGEIISCDSMQFYKGLDIGTAKVRKEEMEGITHHLIDILEPDSEFSVAIYQEIVRKKIAELEEKNITPILVGGSGLYISSVLYDYRFDGQKRDDEIESQYDDYSTKELAELLKEVNPHLAEKTDLKNRRRLLRALQNQEEDIEFTADNPFYDNAIVIGLDMDRETLYERIDKRVDLMIEEGLEVEAKKLYDDYFETQAAMAIGYKEFFHYFTGKISKEEAIDQIKKNSRHYAKRQLTWFRNKFDCFWIMVDPDHFEKAIEEALLISNYL